MALLVIKTSFATPFFVKRFLGLLALSAGMLLSGRAEASTTVMDSVNIEMPEQKPEPATRNTKKHVKEPSVAVHQEKAGENQMNYVKTDSVTHTSPQKKHIKNSPDTRELLRKMNSGIANDDIRIKGKYGNEAAVSIGIGRDRKSYIVELDEEGHAISAKESQEGYDAIVYGGRNELNWVQVAEMNSFIRSKKKAGEETVGQVVLKASKDTASLLRQIKREAMEASMQEAGLTGSALSEKALLNERKVDEAFRVNDGRISPYGSLGCADTVVVAGAYYNKDLRKEAINGTAYVPTLRRNLEDKGYKCEEFNGYAKKGDLLIYGDDEHVVISDGKGGCFGNSSSRGHAMRYKDAYNAWHRNTPPVKIIRMS